MRPIVFVLAVAAFLSSGCGTVCNLAQTRKERPFGGVQFDIKAVEVLAKCRASPDGRPPSPHLIVDPVVTLAVLAMPVVDMPLSLVGDILTFPLARWLEYRRERKLYSLRVPEITAPSLPDR